MSLDLRKLDAIQGDLEKNIPAIRKLQTVIEEKQSELDQLIAKLSPEVRGLLDGRSEGPKATRRSGEAGQRVRLSGDQMEQLKTAIDQSLKGKKLSMSALVEAVNKVTDFDAKDTQVRNVLKGDKKYKMEGDKRNATWSVKG